MFELIKKVFIGLLSFSKPRISNILINTKKNCITSHSWLTQVDVMGRCNAVDNLSEKNMCFNQNVKCKVKYFFITGINESNVNLTKKNVTQIKNGITIKANLTVTIQQNIVCTQKIIFGILKHVLVKMINIQEELLVIP